MARGNAAAQTAANQGNANATTFGGNSAALYGQLTPQLFAEAANPQGFNPTDRAKMRTEAMQTAGGTQSAAVGRGALLGARTGNKGAAADAVADASRGAGEQLSKDNLAIDTADERMKQQQRQSALSGLTGLTTAEGGLSNQALGEVPGAVNADTNARNASWDWTKLLEPSLQFGSVKV